MDGSFGHVFVGDGYGGRITLDGPVQVLSLRMESGTIDQPSAPGGTDITITGPVPAMAWFALEWTGGTINSTSNPATLLLAGPYADALIDPPDTGAVSIGSTLRGENGAGINFDFGVVEFTGGEGMVLAAATASVPADENVYVEFARGAGTALPPQITLFPGSLYIVSRRQFDRIGKHYTELPILNEGGGIQVAGGIRMEVTGQIGGGPGPSFYQTGGRTQLFGGSQLVVPSGAYFAGGELNIWINADGTRADIVGDMLNDGARVTTIGLNWGYSGSLRVVGNVTWYSGVYVPEVMGGDGTKSFVWRATGTFTVGANAQIDPHISNPNVVESGDSWAILEADGGIIGEPASLAPGSPEGYDVFVNNPPRQWRLVKL